MYQGVDNCVDNVLMKGAHIRDRTYSQTCTQSPMSVRSSERMANLHEPIGIYSRVCRYDNLYLYKVLASTVVDTT